MSRRRTSPIRRPRKRRSKSLPVPARGVLIVALCFVGAVILDYFGLADVIGLIVSLLGLVTDWQHKLAGLLANPRLAIADILAITAWGVMRFAIIIEGRADPPRE